MGFVASVSPQSRASLAAACGGKSEKQAGHMLEQLLSGPAGLPSGGKFNNGFTWVFDTNVAREASLVLGADEVVETSKPGVAAPSKPETPTLLNTPSQPTARPYSRQPDTTA